MSVSSPSSAPRRLSAVRVAALTSCCAAAAALCAAAASSDSSRRASATAVSDAFSALASFIVAFSRSSLLAAEAVLASARAFSRVLEAASALPTRASRACEAATRSPSASRSDLISLALVSTSPLRAAASSSLRAAAARTAPACSSASSARAARTPAISSVRRAARASAAVSLVDASRWRICRASLSRSAATRCEASPEAEASSSEILERVCSRVRARPALVAISASRRDCRAAEAESFLRIATSRASAALLSARHSTFWQSFASRPSCVTTCPWRPHGRRRKRATLCPIFRNGPPWPFLWLSLATSCSGMPPSCLASVQVATRRTDARAKSRSGLILSLDHPACRCWSF
mmetsp:Transcript_20752/g.40338  ORF Transcript_20752/g.40338 Transcript_20752/m.40338 type:complete len:350 (+) Transcript_20752:264-1313(+)